MRRPQSGCAEREKDCFWHELQGVAASYLLNDRLIVCGDLHGHVEGLSNGYKYHNNNGYGTLNNDGTRILEMNLATL